MDLFVFTFCWLVAYHPRNRPCVHLATLRQEREGVEGGEGGRERERVCVCMCVCMWEGGREGEREREKERERERERENTTVRLLMPQILLGTSENTGRDGMYVCTD